MFNRVETSTLPLPLPKEWGEEFKQNLLKIYGDKCLKDDRTFEIYAYTFPKEVLLIVSYVSFDQHVIPTTLFLSADLSTESKPEKVMDTLCDSVGVFFDHYFAQTKDDEEFEEFVHEWTDEEMSGITVYYKITRENIALTLEADRLLTEH
jgi:hypothetical protein